MRRKINGKLKKEKKRWLAREKSFLKENAGKMKDGEIAEKLNKSIRAVREMRYSMGIKKIHGRGKVGTA